MSKDMEKQQETITIDTIEKKVIEAVSKALDLAPEEISLTSSFERDLGAESLDYLDIAFMLEREFKIQFPREDLLQRASDYFGEDALVTKEGLITDLGIELLQKGMPDIDPDLLKPGLQATDLRPLFTVQSFVRVVERLLEAKEDFPKICPHCGSGLIESEITPEFVCTKCQKNVPFPTGDEVIFQDIVSLSK